MHSKTTIPITEARKRIFEIVDDTQSGSRYYTLTDHGKPAAVIISFDEFESWLETLDIMSRPELLQEIHTARRDYQTGATVDLEAVLKKLHRPHVSTRPQKKRRKKSAADR